MSRKIRYVDLGKVTPEIFSSMWEIDVVLNITGSVMFKWKADRKLCHFWQGPYYVTTRNANEDIWSYDKTDISAVMTSSVLSDVTMMRCWEASQTQNVGNGDYNILQRETMEWDIGGPEEWLHPTQISQSSTGYELAYYTEDEDLTNWIVIDDSDCHEIGDAFHGLLGTILKQDYNIDTKAAGNDSYWVHPTTNDLKKFAGSLARPTYYRMGYADFGLTWNFDKHLTNQIRAVCTGSNIGIKKFDVGDSSEMITGLFEVTSSYSVTLNRDEIETEFENKMFTFLEATKSISSLTTEESQSLWTRGHQRLNDLNWTYYGDNSAYTSSLLLKTIG